jgi:recombination protein RecA
MSERKEVKESKVSPEKLKALQLTMDKIEKSYGKGAIMRMGDTAYENIPVIPSGSVSLNLALGVGGYPRGRVIEIYGPESSGKTTLAIHAIAEVYMPLSCSLVRYHDLPGSYRQLPPCLPCQ